MFAPGPIILLMALTATSFASEECYKNTGDWYKYRLGTKTAYRYVGNTDVSKPEFKDCKAEKVWMMVRHGTRNPSSDTILDMQSELPRVRDLILKYNTQPSELLRHSDLYNLVHWKSELPIEETTFLTHEGAHESIELAERMQARYPELFPPVYDNSTYFFKYTDSQRTEATAKFFAAGLFGKHGVDEMQYPTPLEKDPILEFYKLCDRWRVEVEENPDTVREKTKFEESRDVWKAVNKINRDLNLKEELLTLKQVKIMYEACTFETAWNEVRKSPWCSIFDQESLKAMEFIEDLEYYYIDGYGTELSYKQACPAFGDMYHFLERPLNYSPQVVVYFTHSGTLLKMLAHIGLYKDRKHLKSKDYEDIDDRKWRVSKIGAFATNLAFVSYNCRGEQKVAVFHQEHLIKLPACKKTLCSIDDIREYYKDSIYNCDFEAICKLDS